jgi:hypothetical protein
MQDLKRYLGLLALKAMLFPKGADHTWAPFDRGDFRGYVSADFKGYKGALAEIYIEQNDEFFGMVIKKTGGQIADAYHVLSLVSIVPNQIGAANGSQPIRSETNSTPSAAGSRR